MQLKIGILTAGAALGVFVFALFLNGAAAGGSTRRVKAGENVTINYTCRLKDGKLSTTSLKNVAEDESISKSRIFVPWQEYAPVQVEAGSGRFGEDTGDLKYFDFEVASRLSKAVVGMAVGETQKVTISSEISENLKGEQRYLKVARMIPQPKERRMTIDGFREQKQKEPEIGQRFPLGGGCYDEVVAIQGDEVLMRRMIPGGHTVEMAYGKGVFHDRGDRYELIQEPNEGDIVAVGGLVGRIAEVDDTWITVDHGHPFGGENLFCEVTVEQAAAAPETIQREFTSEEILQKLNQAVSMAEKEENKSASVHLDRLQQGGDPGIVQDRDLVQVHYILSSADGKILMTSMTGPAPNPGEPHARKDTEGTGSAPMELVAGEKTDVPGLGEAVLGMKTGETKRLVVPPEKAFGPAEPQKMKRYPSSRKYPRVLQMSAKEYVKWFETLPAEGKEIDFNPFLRARIEKVTEDSVTLTLLAEDGKVVKEPFGKTRIRVQGDNVHLLFEPEVGTTMTVEGGEGKITGADGEYFVLDLNHPLAGQNVILYVKVDSFIKTSALGETQLPWIEDHDAGLAEAKKEHKPVVLVLYAAWCGWSQRLFDEAMEDPRIKLLKDEFVWVKSDSDQLADLSAFYEQKGFPMIVLMDSDGEVVKKISGYRDGKALWAELEALVEASASS